jgi:hypothetical protein
MPTGDVQGHNRFHVHRYVCLPLDDALDGSLQFIPKPARFKIQSGLPRQIARDKARQQFRAEPLPGRRFDNPMVVFLPSETKQPA